MEELIRTATHKALESLGVGDTVFAVEWPADLGHGDYAVNAAMASAKKLGKSPRDVAEQLAESMRETLGESITAIEVAGPGFINIRVAPQVISRVLTTAYEKGGAWGRGTVREGEKIVFEYSCPNPFKEMHIGHLMSTVIGEASARIIESQGARVLRDTYGGDVGPHVAKTLWALGKRGTTTPDTATEIGEAYAEGSRAHEDDEQAKQEIDTLNTELYTALAKEESERTASEKELVALWSLGRDLSYASHKTIWKALGTVFDYIIHESETAPLGMRMVRKGEAQKVFEESDGAVIYRGEKKGLHTLVFITSRGTPTYETKDIGLAFLKEERMGPFDHSYIMTAAEQSGHFAVFISALEDIAPLLAKKTEHIAHGFLRLTTGKMSSREGGVITARELLTELIARAAERNEDPVIAEEVAIGALKYFILRQAPGGDIIFDPEQSLSLEGDSGPYLQYALVRARSILAQATDTEVTEADGTETLSRLITRFPEVVRKAEAQQAPQGITQYLTQLAGAWNSFYARERILGGESEGEKIALVKAFVTTMENGLMMLGIPAPEKM